MRPALALLWKLACQRWRPTSRPISNCPHPIHYGSELAREGGLPVDPPPTAHTQSNCGSWLASDSNLPADQSPTAHTQSTVGAGLLAKAACEPTHFQQPTPNPTVGAGLPAIATSQPPSFFQVYSMPMSAALTDRHRAAANRATGCCRAVVVFHSVAQGVGWRGTESVDPGRCRGS